MENRGGSGRGQGRKRKAQKYAGPIAKAEKQIVDKLPDLIDAQMKLALGHWKEEITLIGDRQVYMTSPDMKAGQYLIDRIMGKPTQRTEDVDSGDKVTAIASLIRTLRGERGLDEEAEDEETEEDGTDNN